MDNMNKRIDMLNEHDSFFERKSKSQVIRQILIIKAVASFLLLVLLVAETVAIFFLVYLVAFEVVKLNTLTLGGGQGKRVLNIIS